MDQGVISRRQVSMNVLVTGASGFIGTALVLRLTKNGHRVVPLRRAGAVLARRRLRGRGGVDEAALGEGEGRTREMKGKGVITWVTRSGRVGQPV